PARIAIPVALAVILAAELRQTRATFRNWRDTDALYIATLKSQPRASVVHNNYANLLFRRGAYEEAKYHYREAMRTDPHNEMSYANLAAQMSLEGHPAEALPLFQQALAIKPDYVDALLNLGNAYILLED